MFRPENEVVGNILAYLWMASCQHGLVLLSHKNLGLSLGDDVLASAIRGQQEKS